MRLIDADELKEQWTIASPEPYNTDAAEVLDSIKEAPTIDAVPVVRCKDCKHHREINEKERGYLMPDVLICTNAEFVDSGWNPVFPDDFCSRGERRG